MTTEEDSIMTVAQLIAHLQVNYDPSLPVVVGEDSDLLEPVKEVDFGTTLVRRGSEWVRVAAVVLRP